MHALEGISVVSLEHAIAAPLATRHLTDPGARAITPKQIGGFSRIDRELERATRGY